MYLIYKAPYQRQAAIDLLAFLHSRFLMQKWSQSDLTTNTQVVPQIIATILYETGVLLRQNPSHAPFRKTRSWFENLAMYTGNFPVQIFQ